MHGAVALLLLLASSSGEDAKRSAELAKRSIREYDLGQLEAALHDVEEAYMLAPRPEMLFNVGQCQRALEHWREAERAFRNYLRYRPNAANRTVVERLIEEMAENAERAEVVPPPAPVEVAPPARQVPPPPIPPSAPLTQAPPAAISPPPATPLALATAKAPAESHGHALSIALGVGGLASAGVAVWGLAQVVNFQSLQGQSQRLPGTVPVAQALSAQSNAQTGQILAIAGAIVAAGLGVGAGFTW